MLVQEQVQVLVGQHQVELRVQRLPLHNLVLIVLHWAVVLKATHALSQEQSIRPIKRLLEYRLAENLYFVARTISLIK